MLRFYLCLRLFPRATISPFLFRPGIRRATFPPGEGMDAAIDEQSNNDLSFQCDKKPRLPTAAGGDIQMRFRGMDSS